MTKRNRKNGVKRCIISNKPLTNGKEFVIVDYAIDYVIKQGYEVRKLRAISILAIFVSFLAILIIASSNASAITFDNPSIPKINLPEGVDSLISGNNCFLLSDSVGDILATFNLSCLGNATIGVTSLSSGDNYIVLSSSTGDITISLNEANLNSTILDIANDFNNSLENPWTNTSSNVIIKPNYPQSLLISFLNMQGNISLGSNSLLVTGGCVFTYSPIPSLCLEFDTTALQYQFNTLAGVGLAVDVLTGAVRTLNDLFVGDDLFVEGDIFVNGSINKNVTQYYQASRGSGAWANGTYTYLLTNNMPHNFGTNSSGIEDRGIYHEGNAIIREVNIRWQQGTASVPAPDINWELGYRSNSTFITLFNQSFVNVGVNYHEFQAFPNVTIPQLEDKYLIARVFTYTEASTTAGNVLSMDFSFRTEESLT